MGNILVFLQSHQEKILKASLVALTAAQELKKTWAKGEIIGVCLGPSAKHAAEAALEYGLTKVYFSEASALEKYSASAYETALHKAFIQAGCDTLVGPSTSSGKDCFPRLAAKLEAGQASDIIAVNSDSSLKRPMYAGNVLADVEILTENKLVTVRATAFSAATRSTKNGTAEALEVDFASTLSAEVLSLQVSSGGRPELGDAEIVVSGGRALQSSENFEKFIFPLADALGAAVGASRAAVDSGYAPNDWQVGQTGKVVAPNLYLAVGISGAIQHLAGMKDSKVIVALNKDGDAPIFEVADFGLVADLYQAVPELTEAIKKAKAG